MPLTMPEYITVKTAAGATAAYLSPEADGLKDCWLNNKLNGRCTLEFSLPLPGQAQRTESMEALTLKGVIPAIPASNSKWQYLSPFYRIYAPDITGKMREFVIQGPDSIEKERTGKKLWGKITAHESWILLGKKFATISNDPQTPDPPALAVIILSGGSDLSGGLYAPGSAGHALHALLQGTGWTVDVVDVPGIHDLETEKISVLANINQIQKTWGGYLLWDSVNKTVSLRNEETWAPYTGYQVRYAKNLKGITRTEDYDVVTRLYPFGADDLDIGSVNGGKLYIENYSYTDEVLEEIWTNQDIHDPQELLDEGTKYLEKKYRPRYNYRIDHIDRRIQPGFQHEDFDAGHLVDIIDEELIQEFRLKYNEGHRYNTGLMYVDWFRNQTRIIGYRHNVFQPWRGEIEIGDPVEEISAMLEQSRRDSKYLDKIRNSKEQLTGHKLVDGSLIKKKIASAAVDATKMDAKVVILVGDEWTDNDPGAGYVSWSQHKLYYAGKEYNIDTGSTNHKYIYWDGVSGNYSFQGIEPDLQDGQFYIAVNNDGAHDLVWNSPAARKFIGSLFIGDAVILTAHIADLAVTDAKIDSLSANKIIAASLSAITASLGKVTSGEIYSAKFQSGAEGATDYVQIDAGDSPVRVVENNRTALELWTSSRQGLQGSGGSVLFRDVTADDKRGFVGAYKGTIGGDYDGIVISAEDGALAEKDIVLLGNVVRIAAEAGVLIQPAVASAADVVIDGNVEIIGGRDLHVGGDLSCDGTKPAIHRTKNYGRRAMYARESPNLKFIEETVSRLVAGECRVQIDPVFLETVEPHTEKTPWAVFCTPYADIGLYVAEIGESHIIIRERCGGTSDSYFSWSMSAYRAGYANVRMEEYVTDKGKSIKKLLRKNGAGSIDPARTTEESLLSSDPTLDSK
ncbi:MAG: phage tail protein [Firmicutes bacterium]|nr:phage tail protein [Bacillota bacterium]